MIVKDSFGSPKRNFLVLDDVDRDAVKVGQKLRIKVPGGDVLATIKLIGRAGCQCCHPRDIVVEIDAEYKLIPNFSIVEFVTECDPVDDRQVHPE